MFYKGWHSGAFTLQKRKKEAEAKKVLAGSKPAHVYSVVCLKVKDTLHIVVFVFALCSFTETKLLLTASFSLPYHLPTLSFLFLSKTGNSQLPLPFDPPLLSRVLSPAQGWAPSASGADTGHLSSPVTEPHKAQHLITPHHHLTVPPTPDSCKYTCLYSHCMTYHHFQKHHIEKQEITKWFGWLIIIRIKREGAKLHYTHNIINLHTWHYILTGKRLAINFQESVPCCSTSFFSFSSWEGVRKKRHNPSLGASYTFTCCALSLHHWMKKNPSSDYY